MDLIKMKRYNAFSLAEMLIVMLVMTIVITAMVPLTTRKYQRSVVAPEHGSYECYYDKDNNLRAVLRDAEGKVKKTNNPAYVLTGQYADNMTVDGKSCKFAPDNSTMFYLINMVGGGSGGHTPNLGSVPAHTETVKIDSLLCKLFPLSPGCTKTINVPGTSALERELSVIEDRSLVFGNSVTYPDGEYSVDNWNDVATELKKASFPLYFWLTTKGDRYRKPGIVTPLGGSILIKTQPTSTSPYIYDYYTPHIKHRTNDGSFLRFFTSAKYGASIDKTEDYPGHVSAVVTNGKNKTGCGLKTNYYGSYLDKDSPENSTSSCSKAESCKIDPTRKDSSGNDDPLDSCHDLEYCNWSPLPARGNDNGNFNNCPKTSYINVSGGGEREKFSRYGDNIKLYTTCNATDLKPSSGSGSCQTNFLLLGLEDGGDTTSAWETANADIIGAWSSGHMVHIYGNTPRSFNVYSSSGNPGKIVTMYVSKFDRAVLLTPGVGGGVDEDGADSTIKYVATTKEPNPTPFIFADGGSKPSRFSNEAAPDIIGEFRNISNGIIGLNSATDSLKDDSLNQYEFFGKFFNEKDTDFVYPVPEGLGSGDYLPDDIGAGGQGGYTIIRKKISATVKKLLSIFTFPQSYSSSSFEPYKIRDKANENLTLDSDDGSYTCYDSTTISGSNVVCEAKKGKSGGIVITW